MCVGNWGERPRSTEDRNLISARRAWVSGITSAFLNCRGRFVVDGPSCGEKHHQDHFIRSQ